jgi:aryl-alcohol dehydrogenase-like predicted oxidoreductase
MQTRELGKSGLRVSAIGFGCMGLNFAYGDRLEKPEAIALLRKAYDLRRSSARRFSRCATRS